MKKLLFGIGLTTLVLITVSFRMRTEGEVKWMTFEEAVEKSKTEKRKIFVDVYTDWCGWCKVMDKNTFNEAKIAKILNEEFYAVKLNAEQRADIVFNGNTFKMNYNFSYTGLWHGMFDGIFYHRLQQHGRYQHIIFINISISYYTVCK